MLTNQRDAFRGQSRSPNGTIRYIWYCFLLVCYGKFVLKTRRSWDIRLRKMSWPWNPGQRSLKVIGTDTDRSVTDDFLLTLHGNHEPVS